MNKLDFYIQEAISQARYALFSYQSFKAAYDERNTELVFYHLHHFVLHVTNIDKTLFPDEKNKFRNDLLEETQETVEIDFKEIRQLRNHLEHFDERLDKYVKNYSGQAFFDNNLVTGLSSFPENDFLRALDGETYKFYGKDFNLSEIHSHVGHVLILLSENTEYV